MHKKNNLAHAPSEASDQHAHPDLRTATLSVDIVNETVQYRK